MFKSVYFIVITIILYIKQHIMFYFNYHTNQKKYDKLTYK